MYKTFKDNYKGISEKFPDVSRALLSCYRLHNQPQN